MDILTVIATSVSAISAVVGAVVAIIIAILTAKTLNAYKRQVQIGQDQIHVTQEQTYNQARPVLIPPSDIKTMMRTEQGRTFVQWGQGQPSIEGLQNIGVGPAFTIYGIFFGPPMQNRPPHDRYVLWNYGFLSPGAAGPTVTLSQGTSLKSETTINGHVLYVPDDADHLQQCSQRLSEM